MAWKEFGLALLAIGMVLPTISAGAWMPQGDDVATVPKAAVADPSASPLLPGQWSLNVATIPDAVPQGRLRWDSAIGIFDPTAPGGPCLLQPTRLSTGVPLGFYYQSARLGLNAEGPSAQLLSAPSTCGSFETNGTGEAGLGSYLNVVATVGAGSGNDGTQPGAPTGAITVVEDSIRWVVRRCDYTFFEPGDLGMSRRMAYCAGFNEPAHDLSRHVSPEDGSGSIGTGFAAPRLGDLFPVGSGSGWIVSCLRLDVIEHLPNGSVYHQGLTAHDWFYLADQGILGHVDAVLPSTWYDLSGDNGCPISFPPLPVIPLLCYDSELKVTGLPSTSPNADFDGPIEIRLKVGDNRRLVMDRIDAGNILVQTHDVDPTTQTHSWHLDTIDSGIYRVSYEARTSCPWPNIGNDETWNVTLHMHKPGSKCVSQGNGATGTSVPFAVGFHTYPAGLTAGSPYNGGIVTLTAPAIRMVAVSVPFAAFSTFVQATSNDPNVRYCEIDGHGQSGFTPDDTSYGTQYGPGQIHAPAAWDTTLGTTGKVICIVDSGVRYTHPDLSGVRWLGGHDFINGDSDPDDDLGHGTHVAGIAAATIHNSAGIAGIAQAGIKAVKVIDAADFAPWTTVAAGIIWCADNGGDVINVSIYGSTPSTDLADAIAYAVTTMGKIVVTITGNDGPCANCVSYPGKYAEGIAVAATDNTESQWVESMEGPETDLAAPGVGVYSTAASDLPATHCGGAGSDYAFCTGTSMAAPHVAGAAALIWSHVPGLTNAQVRHYLECKAKDKGLAGQDDKYGHGIVQLKESLDAAIAGSCDPIPPPCTGSITLNGAAPGGGTYRGPTLVAFTHSGSDHPTSVTASASDGARIYVNPTSTHDQWYVYAGDHGTRRVTLTVVTPCGTFTASWMQYN